MINTLIFIATPIVTIGIIFLVAWLVHSGKKELEEADREEEKKLCTDCKYFVGCECFSGMPCDLYTEPEKVIIPTWWISVTERLPKQSGKYLVYSRKSGLVYQTKFYTYPENKGGHWGQKDNGKNITHWMYLPEPPKMKGADNEK